MGHSHGRKWTDDDIVSEIKNVMNSLNILRMPTRKECDIVTLNTALSNKISKSGGFYFWAEKIGLNIKPSDAKTGIDKEFEVIDYLNSIGLSSEATPLEFTHDILVESCVKIDVKYSNGYDYGSGLYYSFNLEYVIPKSDFLVLICSNVKTIVIPSHIFSGKSQASIGVDSRYDKYIDNWNSIRTLAKCFKSLEK